MMNVAPPNEVVDWLMAPNRLLVLLGVIIGSAIVVYAASSLLGSRRVATAGARGRSGFTSGASSWQLVLLATTGLVLSLASGYTTWKGMTNFTGEAVLSLMVTFGIQGVMLIVAWLIGESFATGMNRRLPDGRAGSRWDATVGMLVALVVVAAAFVLFQYGYGTIDLTGQSSTNWGRFADVSAYFALALIVVGVLAFNFKRGGELSLPYIQSSRVIIKNAVLWVMFIACMGTSVFFSYDALFTVIFPKEERARAAQLRAQNQVAGIVADIGSTIERRRMEEMDQLFRHDGWKRYDANLTQLYQRSQGAERAIEQHFENAMEARKRAIHEQQERIATARSGSAGMRTKQLSLGEELTRLKSERPALASDLAAKKSELEARARGVDAKRVEAQAEAGGAEGTGKVGKGPMYRQRSEELRQLEAAYKIQQRRVTDAEQRTGSVNTRIARIESELAQINGEIAKYGAEASTAEARIKVTEGQSTEGDGPRVDPARVRQAFDKARTEFRQGPNRERLAALQQQCSDLYGALAGTAATKELVRGIDCDPKQAAEASAVMFGLNTGIATFAARCDGGDKLEQNKTTDGLWTFARTCLADSGLPSRETDQMRNRINTAELSRDDRAHPFVATLNAFQDGNKLAYLALGIAVAMDLLVFMSGLFGANAMTSPLSRIPTTQAISSKQLEAIVNQALQPYIHETAELFLHSLEAITSHDGFSAGIRVDRSRPHASRISYLLTQAAGIDAVRPVLGRPDYYEVRRELVQYISIVKNREFERDEQHAQAAQATRVMTVALQPHVGDHADIVLHHCRPITESKGFSAEVLLAEMAADDGYVVQRALNAGAILNYVQRDERPGQEVLQRYYVHKQLYETLLMISAAHPRTGRRSTAPRLEATGRDSAGLPGVVPKARLGGDITPRPPSLERDVPQTRQLPTPQFVDEMARAVANDEDGVAHEELDASAVTSMELQRRFTASMLEALGLDPRGYVDISGDEFGAALAAAEAFKHVQRTNRIFERLVDEREREAQEKVDVMRDHLAERADAQSPQGQDALRNAYEDVLRNLTIISLLPGGTIEILMGRIVAELETQNGDANLVADEQELLRLVKRVLPRLAANARNGAEDWYRVESEMKQDYALSGQLAAFVQPGKHSIN